MKKNISEYRKEMLHEKYSNYYSTALKESSEKHMKMHLLLLSPRLGSLQLRLGLYSLQGTNHLVWLCFKHAEVVRRRDSLNSLPFTRRMYNILTRRLLRSSALFAT